MNIPLRQPQLHKETWEAKGWPAWLQTDDGHILRPKWDTKAVSKMLDAAVPAILAGAFNAELENEADALRIYAGYEWEAVKQTDGPYRWVDSSAVWGAFTYLLATRNLMTAIVTHDVHQFLVAASLAGVLDRKFDTRVPWATKDPRALLRQRLKRHFTSEVPSIMALLPIFDDGIDLSPLEGKLYTKEKMP